MIPILIFLILFGFGMFCLLFSFKLLANCANIGATLSDRVNALFMIGFALILLAEAYYRCPFTLILVLQ